MAVLIFTINIIMSEYIMKGLLHFVRFREILPFHISFFPSWRIFHCKKKCFAKILLRCLSLNSVESKNWTYSSILSSRVARIFFRKGWWWSDWVWEGWSYWKKRGKNGRKQSNTWQHHCAFWERLMGQVWWKKGGLWPSPRLSVPRGKWCLATLPNCCWITNLFFWDT